MISNHAQFIEAIHDKKIVRIAFYSQPDGGTVDRECAPLDYGPDAEANDDLNRYWVWDPANTAGTNPLGLLSDQIVNVHVLGKDFDPEALGVPARPWFVLREWGREPELIGKSGAAASGKK